MFLARITFILPLLVLFLPNSVNSARVTHTDWVHLSSSQDKELPVPGESNQQTASLVLDIDKDGVSDFVIGARRKAPSLVWFRRQDKGWERYIIDPDILPIEAGGAFHDIDGDGDLDIVMGEDSSGNKVYWWENPYPVYNPETPWSRFVIKNSGANKHHDQIFGDFDGDGSAELVFWNQKANQLLLADIPKNPKSNQPWPMTPIFKSASQSEGLAKADIDGDGAMDLVGGGRWFKHTGGSQYSPEVIDDDMQFTRAAVGQLVKGGRPEVVFVVGDGTGRLKWYQWNGQRWSGRDLLGVDVVHGHSLEVADFNQDGHLDIFCGEMHTPGHREKATAWIFFGNGKGSFSKQIISQGIGHHESRTADLDGDGDRDLLIKPYKWSTPRVDILLNPLNSSALKRNQWQRHVIDADKPWRAVFITAADLDGDRWKDIITGGWWYKNPGVSGNGWERKLIGNPLRNMAAVYDFDNDGDQDILGTQGKGSKANSKLVWARNEGNGSFTILTNIDKGHGDFLQGVAVSRFQDKTGIALSWHRTGTSVELLTVPTRPSEEAWKIQQIATTSQYEALSAEDIDSNGTVDLLLGTQWLSNTSRGWKLQTIAQDPKPDRNRLADINGDGLLDAIVGFEAISTLGELVWYEHPGATHSTKNPWIKHKIADVIGPMSLDVGDIDGDGDMDVMVGEHNMANPSNAKLYLFENVDGKGDRWIQHTIAMGDEHHDGAIMVDIDNDKDLDVISIGWSHNRVLLYENKNQLN